MFKINPYLIVNIDINEYIVQTKNSLVIIKNEQLILMLYELEKNQLEEIKEDDFLKYFNEKDVKNVRDFLLKNGIIEYQINFNQSIDDIILIGEEQQFETIFKTIFKGYFKSITTVQLNNYTNKDYQENDFCIVYMNPFNLKQFLKINEYLNDRNVLNKFIFYYNSSLYITNYHKKEWYNPCSICFFSNLESKLRGPINNININYQLLIDLIYKKKSNFNIQIELQNYEFINLMQVLLYEFNLFRTNNNSIVNQVTQINLIDNQVITDEAYYWEECECYE